VLKSFSDDGTRDIFDGTNSRQARAALPRELWSVAARKLDRLSFAQTLDDLRVPPGNRLEELKGNFRGKYSIRINDQFRIVFRFREGNAFEVEIVDYH
jgi:proteic killer suppression protein